MIKTLDPASPAARDLAAGRYVIRTMSVLDMARVAIPWMADAGWNPGLHDAETFPVADPGGFLVGELDGIPIAIVSGVRYGDDFAFLGCYIVAEAFRGHGHGLAIHEAARRRLVGCVQGGDAVLENIATYERIGRVLAYSNARYEGAGPAGRPFPSDPTIDARAVDPGQLAAFDRTCFPASRTAFLRAWIDQPDAHARALLIGGQLAGFGVVRPCHRGWKIGPLFAAHAPTARALFASLCARVPAGETVILDVPEPNAAAVALATGHGMAQSFATARMYTGPAPQISLDRVFGVTTFELG